MNYFQTDLFSEYRAKHTLFMLRTIPASLYAIYMFTQMNRSAALNVDLAIKFRLKSTGFQYSF